MFISFLRSWSLQYATTVEHTGCIFNGKERKFIVWRNLTSCFFCCCSFCKKKKSWIICYRVVDKASKVEQLLDPRIVLFCRPKRQWLLAESRGWTLELWGVAETILGRPCFHNWLCIDCFLPWQKKTIIWLKKIVLLYIRSLSSDLVTVFWYVVALLLSWNIQNPLFVTVHKTQDLCM